MDPENDGGGRRPGGGWGRYSPAEKLTLLLGASALHFMGLFAVGLVLLWFGGFRVYLRVGLIWSVTWLPIAWGALGTLLGGWLSVRVCWMLGMAGSPLRRFRLGVLSLVPLAALWIAMVWEDDGAFAAIRAGPWLVLCLGMAGLGGLACRRRG